MHLNFVFDVSQAKLLDGDFKVFFQEDKTKQFFLVAATSAFEENYW